MLHQSMSQLPSKPGIISLITQLLVNEWAILECCFMKSLDNYHILDPCFWKCSIGLPTAKLQMILCKKMLCVIFFFNLWRNGFRNVHFLMASIENHPFDLLIHKEKCLQGYTLRLEAQFKESGKVHQSTTTPTNLRPWTVYLNTSRKCPEIPG